MRYLSFKWVQRAVSLLIVFSFICFITQNYVLLNIKKSDLKFKHDQNEQTVVLSRKYLAKTDDNINNTSNKSITNITDDLPKWQQYTKSALAVFILSAIGSNTTNQTGFKNDLILTGWEARKHRFVSKKCCVLWKTGRCSSYSKPTAQFWKLSGSLPATQYTCPIKGPLVDVVGVKLEFERLRCPNDGRMYQKVFLPLRRKSGSIGLCSKIVYGDIDGTLLVDWMEFYREMKVDKVFMFTYNLTRKVETILDYYTKIGFLERKHFDFPWKSAGAMTRDIGKKVPSVWQDEQVTVFDCVQRLQGYTYMAIIDLDEFLLPRKQKDLKTMMDHLTSHYPSAAGFTFESYIFAKDWNVSTTNKGSDIFRYLKRTPALYTREKNIIIRERIEPGSIHTHEFKPKAGFNRNVVHHSIGAINHYRVCYSNFKSVCNNPQKQYEDTAILEVAKRFRNRTMRFDKMLTQ